MNEAPDSYGLEWHPTVRPRPLAIWAMRDGDKQRLVALLGRPSFAEPTWDEAQCMTDALNAALKEKKA